MTRPMTREYMAELVAHLREVEQVCGCQQPQDRLTLALAAEVERLERIIDDGGDHRLCAMANEAATAEAVLMMKQRDQLATETRVPTTLEAAGLREEIRSELIRFGLEAGDEIRRLREQNERYRAEVRCRDCGEPVEFERRVYMVPTCNACVQLRLSGKDSK